MSSPTLKNFIVEIRDSSIRFKSDKHKEAFRKYLRQWDGKAARMTIEDAKDSVRSDQMNRYYWLYLKTIAEETGSNKDSVHAWMADEFLQDKPINLFGKTKSKVRSTTKLKTSEFIEYLMNIESLTEIPRPDTTEYWGYSYHK